jgi:hypothetical protein
MFACQTRWLANSVETTQREERESLEKSGAPEFGRVRAELHQNLGEPQNLLSPPLSLTNSS